MLKLKTKKFHIFSFSLKICIGIATLEKEASLYTHSTRLSSPKGWDTSTGFLPVISSKSTTPKEYTSDFSVNLPLEAYSGATYLT